MYHVSWFSSKQYKNIWNGFLKICILAVLVVPSVLRSQVFLFLRNWPSLLVFQQEISQSQHPISDLDSPLCDDKVYHVCAPSVSSPCDSAAKGGANCQSISFLPSTASLAGTTLAIASALIEPGPQKSFNFSRSIQEHIINQQLKV